MKTIWRSTIDSSFSAASWSWPDDDEGPTLDDINAELHEAEQAKEILEAGLHELQLKVISAYSRIINLRRKINEMTTIR